MIIIPSISSKENIKTVKIIKICDICEKEQVLVYANVLKNGQFSLCKECCSVQNLTGVPLSEERKRNISKSKQGKPGHKHTEEHRKKISGSGNPFYGKKHSAESIAKILDNRPSSWLEKTRAGIATRDMTNIIYAQKNRDISRPYQFQYTYGDVVFRSSWELAFAVYLDLQKKEWKYKPQKFKLSSGSCYTPDFFSDGTFYEVKGGFYTNADKFFIAKHEFPEYNWVLVDSHYLHSRGLLRTGFVNPDLLQKAGVLEQFKHLFKDKF